MTNALCDWKERKQPWPRLSVSNTCFPRWFQFLKDIKITLDVSYGCSLINFSLLGPKQLRYIRQLGDWQNGLYFLFLNLLTNTLSVTWLFTYLEHQSSKWSEVPSGIHGINFAAYFAAIICFAQIGQIFKFTIPQTQPLSSIYWSWRKSWQGNLRGLRFISRRVPRPCG